MTDHSPSNFDYIRNQPISFLLITGFLVGCILLTGFNTRWYLADQEPTPKPHVSSVKESKPAPSSNIHLPLSDLEQQVEAILEHQVQEKQVVTLRSSFREWKALSEAVANGTSHQELFSSEEESSKLTALLELFPTDASAQNAVNEIARHFQTLQNSHPLNSEQQTELETLVENAGAKVNQYNACVDILMAATDRTLGLQPRHSNLKDAINFYREQRSEANKKTRLAKLRDLQTNHKTRMETLDTELTQMQKDEKELNAKLKRINASYDDQLKSTEQQLDVAKARRNENRKRDDEDFRKNVVPYRSLLQPFISKGYRQPDNDLALKNDIDKKPMSYSLLVTSGCLTPSESGLRMFFRTASSRRLNNNNDRQLGSFPQMDAGRNSAAQLEQVRLAQKLIREHGPAMVRNKWLAE